MGDIPTVEAAARKMLNDVREVFKGLDAVEEGQSLRFGAVLSAYDQLEAHLNGLKISNVESPARELDIATHLENILDMIRDCFAEEEHRRRENGPDTTLPLNESSWDIRWVSSIASLLPKRDHEAWLGDLHEERHHLIISGYHPWLVSLMTVRRMILLSWAALRIKYEDLVSSKRKQTGQE